VTNYFFRVTYPTLAIWPTSYYIFDLDIGPFQIPARCGLGT